MNMLRVYFVKNRPLFEAATKNKPLLVLLCIVAVLWSVLFLFAYHHTSPREEIIVLDQPRAADPALAAGLEIIDFTEVSIFSDHIVVDARLWFDFDSRSYSVDDFKNFRIRRGKFIGPVVQKISVKGDTTRVSFQFSVELKSIISYADFPLDKHRVDIVVTDFLTDKNVGIAPESLLFNVAHDAMARGWEFYQTEQRVGAVTQEHQAASVAPSEMRLVFSTWVMRQSPKIAMLILLPLILIFLIGLTSLTFDVFKNFNAILSLSVGSMTGLLFFRNVIDKLMPVTDQWAIADYFYLLCIILTVFVLGIQIYFLQIFMTLQDQTNLTQLIERHIANVNIVRGCIFIILAVTLLVLSAAIFFR